MGLDVETLRTTFALVLSREPSLTHRFYDELFTRYPAARPLFTRNARNVQEKMLAEALVSVMDHLEDAPWLNENLRALGAKHRSYGVTDEMYGWVGDALMHTLANAAGEHWSPRAEAAWRDAYTAIASLMQEGARATT